MFFSQVPTIHTWGEFITTVGVPTAILAVILWFIRAWIMKFMEDSRTREERMANRIDRLEEFQNTTLLTLLGETKAALTASTETIRELHQSVLTSNESVKELVTRMMERPCLLPLNCKKED
jgi:hypothetical protein